MSGAMATAAICVLLVPLTAGAPPVVPALFLVFETAAGAATLTA